MRGAGGRGEIPGGHRELEGPCRVILASWVEQATAESTGQPSAEGAGPGAGPRRSWEVLGGP